MDTVGDTLRHVPVLVSVAAHQAARVHALPRSAALLTLLADVLHRIAPSTAVVH